MPEDESTISDDSVYVPPSSQIIYMLDADEVTAEEFDAVQEPRAASARGGSQAGRNAVVKARSQLGVRESGGEDAGVPHQRYVRYFWPNSGPQPWCAFFVAWAFRETGSTIPWSSPGPVESVYNWARSNRRLVSTPQAGDMFGLAGQHIGLIKGASSSEIVTIEGNYGDAVAARRIRWRGAGLWFARR